MGWISGSASIAVAWRTGHSEAEQMPGLLIFGRDYPCSSYACHGTLHFPALLMGGVGFSRTPNSSSVATSRFHVKWNLILTPVLASLLSPSSSCRSACFPDTRVLWVRDVGVLFCQLWLLWGAGTRSAWSGSRSWWKVLVDSFETEAGGFHMRPSGAGGWPGGGSLAACHLIPRPLLLSQGGRLWFLLMCLPLLKYQTINLQETENIIDYGIVSGKEYFCHCVIV